MKVVSDMNLEQETHDFFKGARLGLDVLRPVVVELDRRLARRFNFFDSIRLNENQISDVFAYLLDPDATHGQGELFLREFLVDVKDLADADVAVNWWLVSSWSCVRVDREMETTRIRKKCKIDIVIAFDCNRTAIAIENKSRKAPDQLQQLCNYAKHLGKQYKHFRLIYLTPNGEEPSEYSIKREKREKLENEGKFAKASIKNWADGWLKRAEDEVKAEQVRWFVSDFRKALLESLPAQEE